ncbi:MAG: protein TolR [Micavibrio sp.]|nr:protein TolR [Micavibrio sp.]|tara:strand:+ start:94 stop:522 length:429 start_codon:yes stop_codon:yes gene_type:complete
MGAQLGNSRKRGGRYRQFTEINVTPFVDVMLVLLIVFMVSAPLLATGVSVDLPQSEARAISDQDNAPLEVSLQADGKLFIGEREVENDQFIPVLSQIMKQREDKRIYIRADQTLPYSKVMNILGSVNRAGFSKVALISDPVT